VLPEIDVQRRRQQREPPADDQQPPVLVQRRAAFEQLADVAQAPTGAVRTSAG
jgi:hypothetical protein